MGEKERERMKQKPRERDSEWAEDDKIEDKNRGGDGKVDG